MSLRVAAGTIVAKNYIAYARVWASSFREHHPDARIVVLLSDRNDGAIDASSEPFEIIEAETLGIDAFVEMAFRYDVMELSTAVEPAFVERLLGDGADLAFYFDPDIRALRRGARPRRPTSASPCTAARGSASPCSKRWATRSR